MVQPKEEGVSRLRRGHGQPANDKMRPVSRSDWTASTKTRLPRVSDGTGQRQRPRAQVRGDDRDGPTGRPCPCWRIFHHLPCKTSHVWWSARLMWRQWRKSFVFCLKTPPLDDAGLLETSAHAGEYKLISCTVRFANGINCTTWKRRRTPGLYSKGTPFPRAEGAGTPAPPESSDRGGQQNKPLTLHFFFDATFISTPGTPPTEPWPSVVPSSCTSHLRWHMVVDVMSSPFPPSLPCNCA